MSSGIVLVARGPIVPACGQTALERADPSGREIAPNVPPRVLNAQHNVPPYVRNVPLQAGRPISSAGRQARNTGGMQGHNNDPARNRRTDRLNATKAVRDLSKAHGHNNSHVRASITHVQVVAVHRRASARSVRNLNRTRPNNNPV